MTPPSARAAGASRCRSCSGRRAGSGPAGATYAFSAAISGSGRRRSAASPQATSTATGVTIWRWGTRPRAAARWSCSSGPTADQASATARTGTRPRSPSGPARSQATVSGAFWSREISTATIRPACRATISRSPRSFRTRQSPGRARSTSSRVGRSGSPRWVARCSAPLAASPPPRAAASASGWPSPISTRTGTTICWSAGRTSRAACPSKARCSPTRVVRAASMPAA